jgi:uncharacterized protein YodC (DUF2158 family)
MKEQGNLRCYLFLDYCQSEPPCVTVHPQSVTLSYGSLLSLSCDWCGDTKPSFQWLKDQEEIPGATSPDLVISPVSQDHEGTYTCRVFNNVGTVSSRSANVRVTKGETKGKLCLSQKLKICRKILYCWVSHSVIHFDSHPIQYENAQ